MRVSSQKIWFFIGLVCSLSGASFAVLEPWDELNDPVQFDPSYVRNVYELPKSGALEKTPWADTYWPSIDGGVAHRWQVSPNFQALSSQNKVIRSQYAPYVNDSMVYQPYSIEQALQLSPRDFQRQSSPIERLGFITEKAKLRNGQHYFDSLLYKERERLQQQLAQGGGYWRGWEGLCNGWAIASLLHPEPTKKSIQASIKLTQQSQDMTLEFASSDIKGLLALFYQQKLNEFYNGKIQLNYKSLGTRCGDKPFVTKDVRGLKYTNPCGDLNAGAFHLVMTNEIGRLKRGFVMDMDGSDAVWNHPIASYRYQFEAYNTGEVVKYQKSRGSHPNTQYEVRVFMWVKYQQELAHHEDAQGEVFNKNLLAEKQYQYRLEIGANDEILGGSWETGDHPDFAWRLDPIPFDGFFKALDHLVPKQ